MPHLQENRPRCWTRICPRWGAGILTRGALLVTVIAIAGFTYSAPGGTGIPSGDSGAQRWSPRVAGADSSGAAPDRMAEICGSVPSVWIASPTLGAAAIAAT